MVTVEKSHVLNFEGFYNHRPYSRHTNIQIIQTKKSNSIVNIETEHKGVDVILSLLQAAAVEGVRRSLSLNQPTHKTDLKLHTTSLGIETDQQLQLLHHRTHQTLPVVLQGGLRMKESNKIEMKDKKDMNLLGGQRMRRISSGPWISETLLQTTYSQVLSGKRSKARSLLLHRLRLLLLHVLFDLLSSNHSLLLFFHSSPETEWLVMKKMPFKGNPEFRPIFAVGGECAIIVTNKGRERRRGKKRNEKCS